MDQSDGSERFVRSLRSLARGGELVQFVVDERAQVGGDFDQASNVGLGPQYSRFGWIRCRKLGPPDASNEPDARSGQLDMRAQAEVSSAL
jgi:hypothetical protein